ncbi:MAG TPA: Holliday junction resolvase RuvX [Candidatus Dormibacteraeota bacterium]|jgi:putative Holliday junction resolvase
MAVDLGSRRVGIAVSDPTGTIAQPLSTVPAEPAETLVERLAELAGEQEATMLVVGLPRRLDGGQGPEAKAARALAGDLRRASGLPVELVDERMTSVAAERALLAGGASRARRRALSDQVAAALILQSYLDAPRRRT